MAYKTNIGFEAAAVPALLELWLAENLPADFTIKQRKCQGLRVVEITVTGSTLQDLQCKRAALAKTVRAAGFHGIVVKDKKPKEF